MVRIISILCLLLFGFPAFPNEQSPSQQISLGQEEQEVYETLLPKDGRVRINPKFEAKGIDEPDKMWTLLCKPDKALRTKDLNVRQFCIAFNDLVWKCKTSSRLSQWKDSLPVSEKQSETESRHEAVFGFSPIGFDANRQLAMVYRSAIYGPEAGSGDYFFLRKQAGKWVIVGSITMWIS